MNIVVDSSDARHTHKAIDEINDVLAEAQYNPIKLKRAYDEKMNQCSLFYYYDSYRQSRAACKLIISYLNDDKDE